MSRETVKSFFTTVSNMDFFLSDGDVINPLSFKIFEKIVENNFKFEKTDGKNDIIKKVRLICKTISWTDTVSSRGVDILKRVLSNHIVNIIKTLTKDYLESGEKKGLEIILDEDIITRIIKIVFDRSLSLNIVYNINTEGAISEYVGKFFVDYDKIKMDNDGGIESKIIQLVKFLQPNKKIRPEKTKEATISNFITMVKRDWLKIEMDKLNFKKANLMKIELEKKKADFEFVIKPNVISGPVPSRTHLYDYWFTALHNFIMVRTLETDGKRIEMVVKNLEKWYDIKDKCTANTPADIFTTLTTEFNTFEEEKKEEYVDQCDKIYENLKKLDSLDKTREIARQIKTSFRLK